MNERSGGTYAFPRISFGGLNIASNWKDAKNRKRILLGVGVITIVIIIVMIAACSESGKFRIYVLVIAIEIRLYKE